MSACRLIVLTCLTLLCAQLGCGDSGKGGSGISTGLPVSEKLSSLDDTEAKKVCTGIAQGFNNFLSSSEKKTIECTSQAVPLSVDKATGKGDVAKCKDLVGRCLNGEKISADPGLSLEEIADEMDCDTAGASDGLKMCDATVGDLESCGNAVLDELSGRLRLIDCDNLADIENVRAKVEADLDAEKLPGCKTLTNLCPDVELGD